MSDVLIVGQGLAGSLLGWTLERAGIAFEIADAGLEHSATAAVAAGIVNPITGRRLVKTWQAETLLPLARATYREIGDAIGTRLWHEMRVRRLFADERERETWAAKSRSGELEPFVDGGDEDGFWIKGAARVDLRALLAGLRKRWAAAGRLRTAPVEVRTEIARHELVIDCGGMKSAREGEFGFVPWEFSKGEVLEIEVDGLVSDVVLNRRHWVMPIAPRRAWVGATHEPGVVDRTPSDRARATLEASARGLVGERFSVLGHAAGVRVNLPDKRPVAGRHPEQARWGLVNGLGAKGVLWAPWLAAAWVANLRDGIVFPEEADVRRFA